MLSIILRGRDFLVKRSVGIEFNGQPQARVGPKRHFLDPIKPEMRCAREENDRRTTWLGFPQKTESGRLEPARLRKQILGSGRATPALRSNLELQTLHAVELQLEATVLDVLFGDFVRRLPHVVVEHEVFVLNDDRDFIAGVDFPIFLVE